MLLFSPFCCCSGCIFRVNFLLEGEPQSPLLVSIQYDASTTSNTSCIFHVGHVCYTSPQVPCRLYSSHNFKKTTYIFPLRYAPPFVGLSHTFKLNLIKGIVEAFRANVPKTNNPVNNFVSKNCWQKHRKRVCFSFSDWQWGVRHPLGSSGHLFVALL